MKLKGTGAPGHRGTGKALLLAVLVTGLHAGTPARLHAQCPDGTPPPCRGVVPASRPAAAAPLSIAVLPFENRSPDSNDAYLAEGMTEEIGNRLTQVGRLQIKSRGLVRAQWQRTPEPVAAARALSVAWFVHGNLRHVGGQLVVNVELVRASSGEEAWASRFPRRDADVFAVQAEIAESVAVMVGGHLTPGERRTITRRPTLNNEAYRLYLYANALVARRTAEDLRQAVTSYERALALDPQFAGGWAHLALARSIQASWGWEPQLGADSLNALSRVAARRALRTDSTLADAWLAVGLTERDQGNVSAARDALERAARLDTSSADVAHLHASSLYAADCPFGCLNLPRYAIPLFRRALALDPTLRNSWRQLAASERDSGLLAESEAHLDTALSFGPWPPASADRAWVRYLRGSSEGAAADHRLGQGSPQERPLLPVMLRLVRGDSSGARDSLAALRAADTTRSASRSIRRATLAMVLGLHEEALTALETLRRNPDPGAEARCSRTTACSANLLAWRTLRSPIFAGLRAEPRFQRLWNETRPHVPWLLEPDR